MQELYPTSPPKAKPVASPDILVVSRTFLPDPGGIQEYVYNRCCQDGDRIIVLTASCPGFEKFDSQQSFPIYRWPEFSFCRALGPVGSILKQILYMVSAVFCALKLFRRYRFRYIEWGHGYDFPALLVLSYLLPIQFFLYLHGDDLLCPSKNSLFQKIFEWTLNRAQATACNSQFTQNYLSQNFRVQTPSYVIHPSVRPGKFGSAAVLEQAPLFRAKVRARYNIPASAVVILTVGRLVRRKGFDRVIQQLPALKAAGLEVYYLVAGRGAMEAELRQMAIALEVADQVIFAGYVPDSQLAEFYAASDLFAMLTFFDPSSQSIEGFGIVYLEAGYFGKPVLASRVGGVEDAVQDGKTGILVNPDSEAEIYTALEQLCRDPELRDRLGQQGQALAHRSTPHRLLYQ